MGFLDELKHKAGDLGEKAREGLGLAKDKAADLVGDVRERFDSGNDTSAAKAPDSVASGQGMVGDETYFGPDTATSGPGVADALVSDSLSDAPTGLGDAPPTGLEDTVSDAAGSAVTADDSVGTLPEDLGVVPEAGGLEPADSYLQDDSGVDVTTDSMPTTATSPDLPADPLPSDPLPSDTVGDATADSRSFEDSAGSGGFHPDEVSGGLDTSDDALDAVQAETEELRGDSQP